MTSANSDTELLTEHFGYPPVSLIDDIINSINILAERALNSVEQGLLNAPPATLGFKPPKATRGNGGDAQKQAIDPAEAAKNEVESGTHQLETLLCASIDRNFDKFEIYVLRNILCVRPFDVMHWMRLSHYDGLDLSSITSTNSQSNTPTLDTINHLRRKLRESMRLNALLTAERARNESLLNELQSLIGLSPPVKTEKPSPTHPQPPPPTKSPFAFLHDRGSLTDGGSEAPLSTTTAFTLSQMQALRALSASLRNLAPDLAPPPPDSTSDPEAMDVDDNGAAKSSERKTWRRERLEYVEGATRRYLENVEGLELGKHGEVRDGEWQGEGRGLARDEVGGLESVITLLGGEAGGSGPAGPSTTMTGDRMDES
ncbi:Mis12 protein-domain-containing protein [Annulohypoxylon maeteangense]|uniref:Mis12 protein-domain-containing protein n=1 Tax=Annulohypoxylon maeteangense TaxID=1927788 RepID=UPI00200781F8|nr:Mis12 protein-domain-containing protein [Annulohypoxylon maeteangense]KAI0887200.1 Mis12 protein-domain-containing protein [Annulohypoxylon maeteangense]